MCKEWLLVFVLLTQSKRLSVVSCPSLCNSVFSNMQSTVCNCCFIVCDKQYAKQRTNQSVEYAASCEPYFIESCQIVHFLALDDILQWEFFFRHCFFKGDSASSGMLVFSCLAWVCCSFALPRYLYGVYSKDQGEKVQNIMVSVLCILSHKCIGQVEYQFSRVSTSSQYNS